MNSTNTKKCSYLAVNGFILLIIPIIVALLSVKIRGLTTPYFVFNWDPEYAYLFNSLNILNYQAPLHVDHPGTPLQILGAIIIKLVHPFEGFPQIYEFAIKQPERYLLYISNVLIGLNVMALFAIGLIVYCLERKVWLGLLAQSSPLFFTPVLFAFPRVSPEPLLIFVSTLSVGIFALLLSNTNRIGHDRLAKIFGITSGLGVATKLTFAPVLVSALFVFREWGRRKLFFEFVIVGLLVFTAPFIFEPKTYFYFGRWLFNLFMGSGIYGQGSHTVINPSRYLLDFMNVAFQQPLFLATLIMATITYLFVKAAGKETSKTTLLLGLILIQIVSLLMVAKHPQSDRYLVPSLSLTGFTLILIILHIKDIFSNSLYARRVALAGVVFMCAVGAVWSIGKTANAIDKLDGEGSKLKAILAARESRISHEYSKCAQVHQDASTQFSALGFGIQWSKKSELTTKLLNRHFSEDRLYTYDPNFKIYSTISTEKISPSELRNLACMIRLGSGGSLEVM